jgi:hypothetical protein
MVRNIESVESIYNLIPKKKKNLLILKIISFRRKEINKKMEERKCKKTFETKMIIEKNHD